ncbi:hypothetical protein GCM10010844_43240 [Deinococcus radiotolerans]|uniref:Uncharacterized protein n=1 Tax=Deinococcus radiotolerans TaxID=1309407 RepID=A0ABQ2FRG5_9DEIO|nr:hypothetical protein GCM10010844_43240 [Deinococcus radiotolerans]
MLTSEEQAVFRARGAFRGGLTLGALAGITGRSGTLPILFGLIEHSLILQAEGAPPRWSRLEPVRSYAAQTLRGATDAEALLATTAASIAVRRRSRSATLCRRASTGR